MVGRDRLKSDLAKQSVNNWFELTPHSVEDITMQIDRVLSDTNLRRDLKAKGIAQAAKFGWDKTASSVRRVLYEAGGLLQSVSDANVGFELKSPTV